MNDQRATLNWNDAGVPISVRFDDPYFSLENGMAETAYVFLQGNDLPDRFTDGFHIAELGFGTGLNFLVTLMAWRAAGCGGHLHFTSFEAYPMEPAQIAQALAAFPTLEHVSQLVDQWTTTCGKFDFGDCTLTVVPGDARKTLPLWRGSADAWYLDGFSPAKNPELWNPALLAEVGRHTAPGGSFATYTAAGFVRRGLTDARFEVSRIPGFGRKRHMAHGRLK